MSEWTPLILADQIGGVNHYSRPDGNGGIEIMSAQDVSAIVERNRAMALHNDGYTADRSMRRVAFIPAVIEQKWTEEGWYPHDKAELARRLNSSEWSGLRTATGVLGVTNGVMR